MNRFLSLSVVLIALTLGSSGSARAADSSSSASSSASDKSDKSEKESSSAGPECIGDHAKKSLETCPAGPTWTRQ